MKNLLTIAPPHEVEQAIRRLGINLRIARPCRNLTIEQVGKKSGRDRARSWARKRES